MPKQTSYKYIIFQWNFETREKLNHCVVCAESILNFSTANGLMYELHLTYIPGQTDPERNNITTTMFQKIHPP